MCDGRGMRPQKSEALTTSKGGNRSYGIIINDVEAINLDVLARRLPALGQGNDRQKARDIFGLRFLVTGSLGCRWQNDSFAFVTQVRAQRHPGAVCGGIAVAIPENDLVRMTCADFRQIHFGVASQSCLKTTALNWFKRGHARKAESGPA